MWLEKVTLYKRLKKEKLIALLVTSSRGMFFPVILCLFSEDGTRKTI